tara:strand:- start:22 stop:459 length:438 start_codon:yes stop_codon:yes gene_type:complete
MEKIYYIGDLNKDQLLEELWKNSNNYHNKLNHSFNLTIAKKSMKNNYPDYVCGRPIKVDIYNEDNVDYSLYDRDNYDGAFLKVINKIQKNNDAPYIPRGSSFEHSNYYHTNSCEQINKDFIEKASCLTNDKKVINEAMQLYKDLF